MNLRSLTVAALALASLGAAGCGSNDKKPTAAKTTPAAVSAPPAISRDTSKKPTIPAEPGPAPTALQVRDIVAGKGRAAKAGDTITVQYVGVSRATGQVFDESWDRHAAITFPLGEQQVIPGWDEGIVGMKVGGRRELVIPPDLAYGAQGSPPAIAPNETLTFVVDLTKVQRTG